MGIWALIPVKSLLDSKRRLSHLLPAEQRAELIRSLLQHELNVLSEVPAISRVLVISSDPSVWDIARQNGALVEEEQASRGLNVAVTQGMKIAARNGAPAVLILPVDLPFITTADVDLMISSGLQQRSWDQKQTGSSASQGNNGTHVNKESGCVMAVCSDDDGSGTNAIFINSAQEFSFHYGPGSFQSHVQEAQNRGLTVHIVSAPGLKFDLDNENDWFMYQNRLQVASGK